MIKLFEMFAGYGGASFALKKAGIPFQCVGYSEIDKYAVQCYEQNHIHYVNERIHIIPRNFGDCTKIDPNILPDFDLLTGGFPCQSFSVAGKRLGEQDTRGTLFHEIIRIAEVKKPKYMLLENVKGLTNKPHRATFQMILSELIRIGYDVSWEVLNSKEHGIPQNRERIWFVCRRIVDEVPGDIDFMTFWNFNWPEKEELKIFLKDILEDEVEEHYYLKEQQVKNIISTIDIDKFKQSNLETSDNLLQLNKPRHSTNRLYHTNGIGRTIRAGAGGLGAGGLGAKTGAFIVASRGRNPKNPSDRSTGIKTEQRLEPKYDGTTNCLSTVQKDNYVCIKNASNHRAVVLEDFRIRKLTPKECFRLQGFINYKTHKGIYGIYKEIQERYKDTGKILSTLWENIGKKEIQWEIGRFWSFQEKEILQSGMYEIEFFREMVERCIATTRKYQSKAIEEERKLRYLWESEKSRYTPQRQKQIEQQFEQFASIVQELSHKRTSQERWLELLKTPKEKKKQKGTIRISNNCVIFLNDEINLDGLSNTQRYKLAGNGWDINLVSKIFKEMFEGESEQWR